MAVITAGEKGMKSKQPCTSLLRAVLIDYIGVALTQRHA
jgi:hypothetical protein